MPSRVAPSAILVQTNLSGAVTDIDDDPDAPDGLWLTAIDDEDNTDLHVSFPTPATAPVVGAGLQEFRAWVRASGPGDNPDARVELWEAGALLVIGSTFSVGSTSGEIISWTWNAGVLADPTGAGVECRIFGIPDGGLLDPDDTIEIGALEWNASLLAVPSVLSGGGAPRVVAASAVGGIASLSGGGSLRVVGVTALGNAATASGGGSLVTPVGVTNDSGDTGAMSGGGAISTVGQRSGCVSETQSLAPTAISDLVALSGSVTDIDDDPDSPDALWLAAALGPPLPPLPLPILATSVTVAFPTPSSPPIGQQEIRVRVRPTFVAPEIIPTLLPPEARIRVLDAGDVEIATVTNTTGATWPTGVVLSCFFDATDLIDPTGASLHVVIDGLPFVLDLFGWTVEPGAIEWNAELSPCISSALSGGGTTSHCTIAIGDHYSDVYTDIYEVGDDVVVCAGGASARSAATANGGGGSMVTGPPTITITGPATRSSGGGAIRTAGGGPNLAGGPSTLAGGGSIRKTPPAPPSDIRRCEVDAVASDRRGC